MKKTCQFCSVEVTTYVEHEVNPFFGISALLIMFVFGFLAFIIVPFLYFVTKNAVHRCSRCLSKMGEKKCFGMPDDYSAPVSINTKFDLIPFVLDMAPSRGQVFNNSFTYLCHCYCTNICCSIRLLRLHAT